MTAPNCQICAKPVADNAYLCGNCVQVLRSALHQIADLVEVLTDSVVRLARTGTGNGGRRSRITPLPWNEGASKVSAKVNNALTTWARHISETTGAPIDLPPRAEGPVHWRQCEHASCKLIRSRRILPMLAGWIALYLPWLRRQPEVGDAYQDLLGCAEQLLEAVDSPPEHWYAGTCDDCTADLYVMPRAQLVQCECGWTIDVADRRSYLLDRARDQLVHAELAGSALSSLDVPITSAQIRGWIRRGRLIERGADAPALSYDADGKRVERSRKLYRLGDVIDLAQDAAEKRRAKVSV